MVCTIHKQISWGFSGNDNLHAITAQKKYYLKVNLADFEGEERFAEYADFEVANEENKYRLTLGSYNGTAGDYDIYCYYIAGGGGAGRGGAGRASHYSIV